MADFFYFCMVNSCNIVGNGNVAFHLKKMLKQNSIESDTFARNNQHHNFKPLSELSYLRDSWILICVKDEAIQSVLDLIHHSNKVLYTSGAVSIDSLKFNGKLGVFYPLQSFTKDKDLNYTKIPFLIEAGNELFLKEIQTAFVFLPILIPTDSEKRKQIHLIAVFVNNFTHHIHFLAEQLCIKNQIPFELFAPLMRETFEKIQSPDLFSSQTGPAKRGDLTTIQSHLELLSENEKTIYLTLTNSILKTYQHEEL